MGDHVILVKGGGVKRTRIRTRTVTILNTKTSMSVAPRKTKKLPFLCVPDFGSVRTLEDPRLRQRWVPGVEQEGDSTLRNDGTSGTKRDV